MLKINLKRTNLPTGFWWGRLLLFRDPFMAIKLFKKFILSINLYYVAVKTTMILQFSWLWMLLEIHDYTLWIKKFKPLPTVIHNALVYERILKKNHGFWILFKNKKLSLSFLSYLILIKRKYCIKLYRLFYFLSLINKFSSI